MALKGSNWRIKCDTARFNGKFDARQLKLTGLWELKDKKVGWQPWIKLTLARGQLASDPGNTFNIFTSPRLPTTVVPVLDGKVSPANWAN